MTPAETIFAGAALVVLAVLLFQWGGPSSSSVGPGRRATLFVKVFIRSLLALAPFVVLAGAAIFWMILPAVTPVDGAGSGGALTQGSVGALITGTVIAVGWVASAVAVEYRQAIEREVTSRDTLIALQSEIMTFIEVLDSTDILADGFAVVRRIRRGDGVDEAGNPRAYYPFSAAESSPVILQAVSGNIPALPDETVAVIVRFYAQLTDLREAVLDARSEIVRDLSVERRAAFHAILVRRRLEVLRRGLRAMVAINRALDRDNPERVERSGKNAAVTHDAAHISFDINDERAQP